MTFKKKFNPHTGEMDYYKEGNNQQSLPQVPTITIQWDFDSSTEIKMVGAITQEDWDVLKNNAVVKIDDTEGALGLTQVYKTFSGQDDDGNDIIDFSVSSYVADQKGIYGTNGILFRFFGQSNSVWCLMVDKQDVEIPNLVLLTSVTGERPSNANEGDLSYDPGAWGWIHQYINGTWEMNLAVRRDKFYVLKKDSGIEFYVSEGYSLKKAHVEDIIKFLTKSEYNNLVNFHNQQLIITDENEIHSTIRKIGKDVVHLTRATKVVGSIPTSTSASGYRVTVYSPEGKTSKNISIYYKRGVSLYAYYLDNDDYSYDYGKVIVLANNGAVCERRAVTQYAGDGYVGFQGNRFSDVRNILGGYYLTYDNKIWICSTPTIENETGQISYATFKQTDPIPYEKIYYLDGKYQYWNGNSFVEFVDNSALNILNLNGAETISFATFSKTGAYFIKTTKGTKDYCAIAWFDGTDTKNYKWTIFGQFELNGQYATRVSDGIHFLQATQISSNPVYTEIALFNASQLSFQNLPTSADGLVAGQLYNENGFLKIV